MDAVRVAIAPVPVADPTTYHLELWPVRARWFTIGGMAYPVRHEIK